MVKNLVIGNGRMWFQRRLMTAHMGIFASYTRPFFKFFGTDLETRLLFSWHHITCQVSQVILHLLEVVKAWEQGCLPTIVYDLYVGKAMHACLKVIGRHTHHRIRLLHTNIYCLQCTIKYTVWSHTWCHDKLMKVNGIIRNSWNVEKVSQYRQNWMQSPSKPLTSHDCNVIKLFSKLWSQMKLYKMNRGMNQALWGCNIAMFFWSKCNRLQEDATCYMCVVCTVFRLLLLITWHNSGLSWCLWSLRVAVTP